MTAPARSRARRLIARSALVLAVLAAGWALFLEERGGFDAHVLGVTITTNDPTRPAVWAVIVFVVFLLANGLDASWRSFLAGTAWMRDLIQNILSALNNVDDRLVAGAIVAATLGTGLMFSSTSAGGADSYGYISQADLWLSGQRSVPAPWLADRPPWPDVPQTFLPLGYTLTKDQLATVPSYPPGLPLLMAAAKRLAGHCAVFAVAPVSGAVLILATFGLCRRLGSSRAGVIAAWLVATSPPFLYMLMAAMSDVPASAAWAVAFWCLAGGTIRTAAGAGLAAGLAVLIRPNLAPLVGVCGLWLAWKIWRERRVAMWRQVWEAAGFVAALSVGVLVLALANREIYGSPFGSGYNTVSEWFAWANALPNIRNYAVWFADAQTPIAFLGIAALFAPAKWLWPGVPDRRFVVICGLFVFGVWLEYCFFVAFDVWWYLRFLLPCWPFIMMGLAHVALAAARAGRTVATLAVVVVIVGVGVRGVVLADERYAFRTRLGDSRYSTAATIVRTVTEPNSVIFSMQHAGSLRYYGGRVTVRWDFIEVGWLERAVAWFTARGIHVYALLEDWEAVEFRRRFGGLGAMGRLEMAPLRDYQGPMRIFLYDLTRSSEPPPATVIETVTDTRCLPPGPPPVLTFKK